MNRSEELQRRIRNITLQIKYARKYYRMGISDDNGDRLIKRGDLYEASNT